MTMNYDTAHDEYDELRERFEPLRPDLHEHLEKTRHGYFIRHPFCNEMVRDLDRCALIHQVIDERTAKADACFEAQDWEGYIACIEIYSQAEWLAKDADLMPDARYWNLLRGIHENQRTTVGKRELFNRLFRADRPGREHLMTPEERDVLARLPDVLTVYRGYSDDDEEGYADGIAWTLDRRAAVWYANWCREHDYPRVITGKIRKEHVWAYLDGAGDLLLPPEAIYSTRDRYAGCEAARQAWSGYIKSPFDVRKLFRK